MRKVQSYRRYVALGVCIVVGLVPALGSVSEEPVASDLDTSGVAEYVGTWQLSLDLMGNTIELFLAVYDMDGKIGATLDSQQQAEPLTIDEILPRSDGNAGLEMNSKLKFGPSFTIDVRFLMTLEDDELVGTIAERSSSLFSAPFVGVKKDPNELELVQGRRPNPTETRISFEGKKIRITFADLDLDSDDYKSFEEVKDGEIFTFTSSRATKLFTDTDIAFGDNVVKTANVAPDYPGVYSLWLKKVGSGWHLVFNEQPDIWGTRHDPASDVAEIPLELTESDEEFTSFRVKLEKDGDDAARIKMNWGSQQWEAAFAVTQ